MEILCRALAKHYVQSLKDEGIDVQDTNTPLVGPWICVAAALCMPPPPQCKHERKALDVAIKFAVMYVHVDTYLDSDTPNKRGFVMWMSSAARGEQAEMPTDVCGSVLLRVWDELVGDSTRRAKWMRDLVECTIHCYEVQSNKSSKTSTLLDACLHKGGTTLLVLHRMIYDKTSSDNDVYLLGSCMQLLDDIVDCSSDIASGIHTYCTRTYKKRSCLDRCATLLVRKLSAVPRDYIMLVTGMYISLRYTVFKSHNFSVGMRLRLGLPPGGKKCASFLKYVEDALRAYA